MAAVSLCMPAFVFLTGLANLFGIGGSSLMARSLGRGERQKARQTAAFSIWTAAAVSLLYGLGLLLVRRTLLPALGADSQTFDFCCQYMFWTVTVGALPTVMNQALAHLVRSAGHASQASFGVALGGILNILLDPVFIFGLRLEVAGAAIATMLSNVLATLYYLVLLRGKGYAQDISLHPRYYT